MKLNTEEILEEMESINPDALKLDGFDDCIIGVCENCKGSVLLYDKAKVIKKLMKRKMSDEEAIEYYEHNILGTIFESGMPTFLLTIY